MYKSFNLHPKQRVQSNNSSKSFPNAEVGSEEWFRARRDANGVPALTQEDIMQLRESEAAKEGLKLLKQLHAKLVDKIRGGDE